MITVVSTCNEKGWKTYGRRMAVSFRKHWPADTRIVFYHEGFLPDVPGLELRVLPLWHDDFKFRHQGNLAAHGMATGEYKFRFDCIRFSHKVAALTDIGFEVEEGLLIWADADTITHKPVDQQWLDNFLAKDGYLAWLARAHKYPECGFLMFRAEHPAHRLIMETIRDCYMTDIVLQFSQTHDSFVIQQLVFGAVKDGLIPPPTSLSGPHPSNNPFETGPLRARMEHYKGKRKFR